jgi:GNAT superfamily N-acetyltransferase
MSAEIYTPSLNHLDAMAERRLILWREEAEGAGLPQSQIEAATKDWSVEAYCDGMLPKMEDPEHYLIRVVGDRQAGTVDGIFVAMRGLAKTLEDYGYRNYLESIQLDPELRGMGYARALMEEYFDFVGSGQVIGLHMFPKNPRAKKFYTRLGFVEDGLDEWNVGNVATAVQRMIRRPVRIREEIA